VQVEPMTPKLTAPGTQRLKLNYDNMLSSLAFHSNLRPYTLDAAVSGVQRDYPDHGAGVRVHVARSLRQMSIAEVVCTHARERGRLGTPLIDGRQGETQPGGCSWHQHQPMGAGAWLPVGDAHLCSRQWAALGGSGAAPGYGVALGCVYMHRPARDHEGAAMGAGISRARSGCVCSRDGANLQRGSS
jgi:hypothetical protein